MFSVFSSFLSNRWLWVGLNGKSSQEYPVNAEVPQGSILGPTLFLLYISHILDDIICNIAIFANHTTLQLWQQLELVSGVESDLQDTVDQGRKWLVDFSVGKSQVVSFDWSNNTVAIDVKMDGSVLEEKLPLKMLGLTFSSKLDQSSYIISIDEAASQKIRSLICSMNFPSLEVALYCHKCTI